MRYFFILILITVFAQARLMAQTILNGYVDLGSNSVSDGMLLKTVTQLNYQYKGYTLEGGLQADWMGSNTQFLSGWRLTGGKNISLWEKEISVAPFYCWTGFSNTVTETNWGLVCSTQFRYFTVGIGTNNRTLKYTDEAIKNYNLGSQVKVTDVLNLMYRFGFQLKEEDGAWNCKAVLTNYDYFLINQETNPMLNIAGYYEWNPNYRLFCEFWYKTSGALNLHVNPFGFLVRTGIIWQLR